MRILLLGSTGSIGASTVNCARRHPDRFQIVGLAARSSHVRIVEQARELRVAHVCLTEPSAAEHASRALGAQTRIWCGAAGLLELVATSEYDILVNALVGAAGLAPTVAALTRGKRVALANKESLVVGGELIGRLLSDGHGSIVPVDSEHSAILQCLNGEDRGAVESIILTASGGPFRDLPADKFATITPEQALRHPTWNMGSKITIDSATLTNKGFEIIEAHHLFNLGYDHLRVWIHPQSIIHSLVEFHDGAVIAQLGMPDMELPIQYALEFPRRLPIPGKRLDLAEIGSLTFATPDLERFPCLRLCIEAGRAGGSAPVVLNAVNEIAVKRFLDRQIGFTGIAQIVSDALEEIGSCTVNTLDEILAIDGEARAYADAHNGRSR